MQYALNPKPAGKDLEGQEALVFGALAEHVAAERAAVLAAQREAAAPFSDKYRFAARRSLQQMEVHLDAAHPTAA